MLRQYSAFWYMKAAQRSMPVTRLKAKACLSVHAQQTDTADVVTIGVSAALQPGRHGADGRQQLTSVKNNHPWNNPP